MPHSRVLVVDDDSDMRFVVQRYLRSHHYSADTAESGVQMRKQLLQRNYDFVILDVNMPGEDGFSIATWLRNNRFTGGILMLTAVSEPLDQVQGFEAGADDYITKPFELRELLARLKTVSRRLCPRKKN